MRQRSADAKRWLGETTDQQKIPTRLCALTIAISRSYCTHCMPDQPPKLHGARTFPQLLCPARRAGAHDNNGTSVYHVQSLEQIPVPREQCSALGVLAPGFN